MPAQVDRRITKTHEVFVKDMVSGNEEPFAIEHTGCFGETVLTGVRRPATHLAHTSVETLVVSKSDLRTVFEENPRAARRIFATVMKDNYRKERLHSLTIRLLVRRARPSNPPRSRLLRGA